MEPWWQLQNTKYKKKKEKKEPKKRNTQTHNTGGDLSTPLSITEKTERKKSARLEELTEHHQLT